MDYGIFRTETSPFASMDFCYWLIIAASAVLMFVLISLHVSALSKTSCLYLKPEFSFKHVQPFDEIACKIVAQNRKFTKTQIYNHFRRKKKKINCFFFLWEALKIALFTLVHFQ